MNKKMIVLASSLFFALFALNTTVAVAAVSNDTCIELPGDCDKCKDADCKGCEGEKGKKNKKGKKVSTANAEAAPASEKKACCSNKEGEKSSCGDKKEASAPEKAETKAK